MKIRPVLNRSDREVFHQLPHRLFAGVSAWRPVFPGEVEAVFSPRKNPLFAQGGTAMRWIVLDSHGTCTGRIAAFVHPRKAFGFSQPTGGIGFFECVDNQEVAFLLFETARQWLAGQGMQAMDGPVNFGENDRFWGLLVEGNDAPPVYGTSWHPAYYAALFRAWGFQPYFRQFSFSLCMGQPLAPRIDAIGKRALARPEVEIRFPSLDNLGDFARDVQTIYNDAWVKHENVTAISEEQVKRMADSLKHILIPPLMPFVYVNGEPAAFAIAIPDLNQMFRSLNGRFPWYEQLRFLRRKRNHLAWYRDRGLLTRARVMVAGVRPAWQRMGIESALIAGAFPQVQALGFRELELGWVGDFNPPMLHLVRTLCGEPVREHQTLRYLFDREAEAQYAPVIRP